MVSACCLAVHYKTCLVEDGFWRIDCPKDHSAERKEVLSYSLNFLPLQHCRPNRAYLDYLSFLAEADGLADAEENLVYLHFQLNLHDLEFDFGLAHDLEVGLGLVPDFAFDPELVDDLEFALDFVHDLGKYLVEVGPSGSPEGLGFCWPNLSQISYVQGLLLACSCDGCTPPCQTRHLRSSQKDSGLVSC